MDQNYGYPSSYPDSGQSSPRSLENTAAWDEQSPTPPPNCPNNNNFKVKFMCSYGGKIQPRPHDNQLSYVGGETKILVVDRSIKFSGLIGKLSVLCDADVSFKYQLPGEDLDALISVTNDDDLEHMMHEYDRLWRASSKPARLRLFLFPINTPSVTPSGSFGSSEGRTERDRLVEALNSGPTQPPPPPQHHVAAPPPAPANNMDFLFGLEKGIQQEHHHHQNPVLVKSHVPVPDHDVSARVVPDDPIQRHIQDLKRLQIGKQEGDRRKSDDNLSSGFSGEYYGQKVPEKLPTGTVPGNLPVHLSGQMYQTTMPGPEQAIYMIPAHSGMYHNPMAGRVPVTAPTSQGYYAVQRMPPEVYRDQQQQQQQAYGLVTQVPSPPVPTVGPPQQQVPGYSEAGFGGMVRSTGVGMIDTGYAQVAAYDNGTGRQVYYNSPGGVVGQPYQGVDIRAAAGVAVSQEGKVVKVTQI